MQKISATFALAVAVVLSVPGAEASLKGAPKDAATVYWVGGIGDPIGEPATWDPIGLRLAARGEAVSGLLRAGGREHPCEGEMRADSFALTVSVEGDAWRFAGRWQEDVVSGEVDAGGTRRPFLLVREVRPDQSDVEMFAGLYAIETGARYAVVGGTRPALVDFETGVVRALYGIGPDSFTTGPARDVPYPPEMELSFRRGTGGTVTGLSLRGADGSIEALRVVMPDPEPFVVTTHAGGGAPVELRGALHLPPGEGPHPAVVWVHGSGQSTRRGAGHWPYYFVARGFACLAMDKRGVGESDGSYEMPDGGHDNIAHMKRRAGDVLATLRGLGRDPRIEADTIGLVGASQAGWIIPQVAGSGDAAFTIILSGGAASPILENVFSQLTDELDADHQSLSIDEALRRTRGASTHGLDFDEHFAKMTCPGLWLYGDRDRSNPSQLCVELLEDVADRTGNDFEVVRFPTGNHALLDCRTGGAIENARLSRYVPDLFTVVSGWLDRKGFVATSLN